MRPICASIFGPGLLLFSVHALAADGKTVYTQICAACHATGVADAPRLGDKSAWAPRVSKGRDAMIASVLKGKGAMPPKGGNASLTDEDAKSAMDFMLGQAK